MGTQQQKEPQKSSLKRSLNLTTPDKLAMVKNSKSPLFKVNLLLHKEEQLKIHLRLIKWLLSSGRFIVVFVEILTISAFIFRYKLDADIADIQEKIKEDVLYIQSMKNDEINIRQTQFQLSTIKKTRDETKRLPQILSKIALLTPKNTKLTNLTINSVKNLSETSISINGLASSNLELSAFLKALQKDPTFTDINLTDVSFEGVTSFTIVGNINDKGTKSS